MARPSRASFPLWHTRRAPTRWLFAWVFLSAVVGASLGHTLGGRPFGLGFALAALTGSLLLHWWHTRSVRAGSLSLVHGTLRRREREREQDELLVSRGELLGLSLLGNRAPGVALIALTSPSRVRYVPVLVRSKEELESLAALLTPTPIDALHLGQSTALLSSKDACKLLEALLQEFPHAATRLFMRGARGEPIALDRSELRIGQDRILLDQPFELRAFSFFESTGLVVSGFQGAWVKQLHDPAMPWDAEVSSPSPLEHLFVASFPVESERSWPVLTREEVASMMRAERHAIDALLLPTLHRALARHGHPRSPESRRGSAPRRETGSERW